MAWASSGRVVNPALDAVIVDTGALPSGTRTPQVIVASTVAAPFELQHRDAANTATLKSQIIACQALDAKDVTLWYGLEMATNERLRVIAVTAITGSVSGSILYQP
jgi:hypothetical protein